MAAVGLIPEYKIANDKDDGGISAVTYLAQVRNNLEFNFLGRVCVKINTNEVVKIRMEFDEFIPGRKIHWKAHVAKDLGACDMIIGRDLLDCIGIDILFLERQIK